MCLLEFHISLGNFYIFAIILCYTCVASSRVGARTRAWHLNELVSRFWRTAVAKVAVFPVPDCACAMTSWPKIKINTWLNENIRVMLVTASMLDLLSVPHYGVDYSLLELQNLFWRHPTLIILAVVWDFQQCGMCDQQRLRSACA